MAERGHGKIVNIASLLSFQGGIRVASYTASKHGVAGITKALANEWGPLGVQVNAIAPGYMATDNTTALRADPDRVPGHPRAHPGRSLGRRRRHRRRRRLPELRRRRLRQRPRPGRRRRLDGPLTRTPPHHAPPVPPTTLLVPPSPGFLAPRNRGSTMKITPVPPPHSSACRWLPPSSPAAARRPAEATTPPPAGPGLRAGRRQAGRPGPQRVQPLRGLVARRRRRLRQVGRPRPRSASPTTATPPSSRSRSASSSPATPSAWS